MGTQIANVPTALTANAFTRAGYSVQRLEHGCWRRGHRLRERCDLFLRGRHHAVCPVDGAAERHTVTFNANGGTGTMSNQAANVPTALTANAFTLDGLHVQRLEHGCRRRAPPTLTVTTCLRQHDLHAQWLQATQTRVVSAATPSNGTPSAGHRSWSASTSICPATPALSRQLHRPVDAGTASTYSIMRVWAASPVRSIPAMRVLERIAFNGANTTGTTGNTVVFQITFDVVGSGTSALDLAYSAMAAATSFTNLLPILTVNDGPVTASWWGPTTR